MSKYLKGNYKLKGQKAELNDPIKGRNEKRSVTEELEQRAFERLGGSIAFVSKSKLVWGGDAQKKV